MTADGQKGLLLACLLDSEAGKTVAELVVETGLGSSAVAGALRSLNYADLVTSGGKLDDGGMVWEMAAPVRAALVLTRQSMVDVMDAVRGQAEARQA